MTDDHPRRTRKAFISYATEDLAAASEVKQELTTKGYDVFLDEDGLRSGDELLSVLRKEIDASDKFVLLWSYHATQSNWVEKEWRQALHIRSSGRESFLEIRMLESTAPLPLELETTLVSHDRNLAPQPYVDGAIIFAVVLSGISCSIAFRNDLPLISAQWFWPLCLLTFIGLVVVYLSYAQPEHKRRVARYLEVLGLVLYEARASAIIEITQRAFRFIYGGDRTFFWLVKAPIISFVASYLAFQLDMLHGGQISATLGTVQRFDYGYLGIPWNYLLKTVSFCLGLGIAVVFMILSMMIPILVLDTVAARTGSPVLKKLSETIASVFDESEQASASEIGCIYYVAGTLIALSLVILAMNSVGLFRLGRDVGYFPLFHLVGANTVADLISVFVTWQLLEWAKRSPGHRIVAMLLLVDVITIFFLSVTPAIVIGFDVAHKGDPWQVVYSPIIYVTALSACLPLFIIGGVLLAAILAHFQRGAIYRILARALLAAAHDRKRGGIALVYIVVSFIVCIISVMLSERPLLN